MKILINNKQGFFDVSEKVEFWLIDKKSWKKEDFEFENLKANRNNPELIEAVEFFGLQDSSSEFSQLSIVEISENVQWQIFDYDGVEFVVECKYLG